MHSFAQRANVLLTFAITLLALMCAIASVSDNFNSLSPNAQVQVVNINWFQKKSAGDDEVSLSLNISANLESLFTWNTKQVFVFLAAEYGTPKNALNQKLIYALSTLAVDPNTWEVVLHLDLPMGRYNTFQRACKVLDPYI
ncbi:hypothetical protein SASPL_145579 [Salvia splendens]|uniref:Signal peptidase complex subunit 3 n=1 Tax=Salvia splendens TaxID=180675 RepID=A0A8X8WHA6_SALSN|nr:hypothetical protein SASPL_145579 [Salvia splendens]